MLLVWVVIVLCEDGFKDLENWPSGMSTDELFEVLSFLSLLCYVMTTIISITMSVQIDRSGRNRSDKLKKSNKNEICGEVCH